jgi:hypothetical protein
MEIRMKQLVIALGVAAMAQAQDVPTVKEKTVEVGAFGGTSLGLDKYRFMGGANVGYGITKVIFPYAEVSYFPGIERTEGITRYKFSVTDFHGGLHLRAPIAGSRVVPYGIIGVGMLRFGETKRTVAGVTSPDDGSTDFAVNGGGGVRIYVTERFGFRFEGKFYKPTGRFSDPFGRIVGGIFFQSR